MLAEINEAALRLMIEDAYRIAGITNAGEIEGTIAWYLGIAGALSQLGDHIDRVEPSVGNARASEFVKHFYELGGRDGEIYHLIAREYGLDPTRVGEIVNRARIALSWIIVVDASVRWRTRAAGDPRRRKAVRIEVLVAVNDSAQMFNDRGMKLLIRVLRGLGIETLGQLTEYTSVQLLEVLRLDDLSVLYQLETLLRDLGFVLRD